ncbi:hypothetical protein D3C72_1045090 [compost metagenome]
MPARGHVAVGAQQVDSAIASAERGEDGGGRLRIGAVAVAQAGDSAHRERQGALPGLRDVGVGQRRQVRPQHQQREHRADPVGQMALRKRLLGHRLARQRAGGQRIARARQRRTVIAHGLRLARVDELRDAAVRLRQRQRRLAQQVEAARGRRHELGAAHRALGVDVEGRDALLRVRIQQRRARQALGHEGQFPGQVVGVVEARVEPAHAEDRHRVRRVAREHDAAVAVALERHRAGAVHRGPHRLPRQVAFADGVEVALHELGHRRGLQRVFGALAGAQLVVDAPDVVGLAVHQHGRAGVPRRVEPGAALGRVVAVQLDVDDHVAAFVARAFQRQPERLAHEALAAVAGREPLAAQAVGALGIAHVERHALAVLVLRERGELGAPADVDEPRRRGVAALDLVQQVLLDVVLLQVDHRRQLLLRGLRHLEAEHLGRLVEAAPHAPRQALAHERRQRAQALDDLQAAARDAGRAAAHADRVVGLEHHAAHAVVGEPQRQRHAHRAAARDHDGVAAGLHAVGAERRQPGREARVVEGADRRRQRGRAGWRRHGAGGGVGGTGGGHGTGLSRCTARANVITS